MNLKAKLKSYNFWVSLGSAAFLLVSLIGKQIGFTIDESAYYDIFTSICGILVILGIITIPAGGSKPEQVSQQSVLHDTLTENFTPEEPANKMAEPATSNAEPATTKVQITGTQNEQTEQVSGIEASDACLTETGAELPQTEEQTSPVQAEDNASLPQAQDTVIAYENAPLQQDQSTEIHE